MTRTMKRKNIISIPRGPTPTDVFVKLKVIGDFNVTTAANTYNSVTSMINFLNPIQVSGLFTQQPTGWDQWSALYQRFTVLGSKCSAIVLNSQAYTGMISATLIPSQNTQAQMVAAMDGSAGSGLGRGMGPIANQYAQTKYISNYQGNNNMVFLKKYIKTKTLFQAKDVVDDPDFTGTTQAASGGAAKPVNDAWWYLLLQVSNASASPVLNVRVNCTYYVKFSSPLVLTAS